MTPSSRSVLTNQSLKSVVTNPRLNRLHHPITSLKPKLDTLSTECYRLLVHTQPDSLSTGCYQPFIFTTVLYRPNAIDRLLLSTDHSYRPITLQPLTLRPLSSQTASLPTEPLSTDYSHRLILVFPTDYSQLKFLTLAHSVHLPKLTNTNSDI